MADEPCSSARRPVQMKVIRCPNYEAMSRAAADRVLELVRRKPDALLCLPTGASPERLYALLADESAVQRVRGMALDEWHDVPEERTCRRYLEQHVFVPWRIAADRRFVFARQDPHAECSRMAGVLAREGPFDLCILGIGRNGHLGLNEPAAALRPHAHVAELDAQSQQHGMLAGARVTRGMTFGMADLLAAREILLLVTGKGKRDILRQVLREEVRTDCPSTLLHLHVNTRVFIDEQCESSLSDSEEEGGQ